MSFGFYTDMITGHPVTALKSPKLQRYLEGAGPYDAIKTNFNGEQVILITTKKEGQDKPIPASSLGEPILLTEDKKKSRVWLLPPKKLSSIADFSKEYPMQHLDVKLTTGKEISIVTAENCPRLIDFSSGGVQGYSTPYGQLAEKLFMKFIDGEEDIVFSEMAELTFYAVSQCYAITRDLLTWINNEQNIFSDSDYELLFSVIMGINAKKSSGSSPEE